MKYTRYLIDEQFIDIDAMNTKNVFLQLPMVMLMTPIAIAGIFLIIGMLPMVASIDVYNYVKSNLLYLIKYGCFKLSTQLQRSLVPISVNIIPNTIYLRRNIRKVIRSPGYCLQKL